MIFPKNDQKQFNSFPPEKNITTILIWFDSLEIALIYWYKTTKFY